MDDPNLAVCLAFVRAQEGGWADVKGDRGGQTMAGVTLATFRAWRHDDAATPAQLRALPAAEWDAIMTTGYYHPCRCQDLPAGVALQVFDMAVNAGVRASVHILQSVVRVAVDGLVGPETLGAVRAAGRGLIDRLNTAQAVYYRSLGGFPQFGHGWLARNARRGAAALAASRAVPALDTHEEAVAQALDAWRAHPLAPAPVAAQEAPGTPQAAPRRRIVAVSPPHATTEASGPAKVDLSMPDFSDIAAGVLKGATAGAALGPFGMAGGAALGLAIQLVPQLSRWIGGDSGQTASQIVGLVQQATGTANPAAQQAAIQDPEVSGALAVQLARIVADREAAAEAAQIERLKASIADVGNARQTSVAMAGTGSLIAFAPPVLSLVILVAFGTMIYVVLTRSISNLDNTLSSILLGTLAAMATQVANFYLGSSSGSQRKDAYLAQSFPASAFPKPSAVVPASEVHKG